MEDEEGGTNQQEFTGMNMMEDETLSYKKEKREKQPTTYAPGR